MTLWTTPRTWVRGELATETLLNTHVRDNLAHLKENQGASGGFFNGVTLGTHEDYDVRLSKVQMRRADLIILDDGVGVADWDALTADMAASGAGGLDTGTEAANAWYEIHAIRRSSDGTKNLLLHRAKDYFLDETYDSDDNAAAIRDAAGNITARAQGFQVDTAGPVEFVDVELDRTGTPAGTLTLQAEIHADAAGVPSNTALATSVKLNPAGVSTSAQWIRFIFRTPVSLTAATQYHLVLTGDWTQSDANYVAWRCDTSSPAYANGSGSTRVGASTWATAALDCSFKIYVTRNDTAVTMPSGYDGKCLIGFVHNNGSSNLRPFHAINKRVYPLDTVNIAVGATAAVPTLISMLDVVPPTSLRMNLYGSDTGGGLWILPVPFGYLGDVAGTWRNNGGVFAPSGSFRVNEIPTETMAIYAHDLVGTYDIVLDSWEW